MDGSDLIEVRGLKLRGHIGVTSEERAQEQPLVVSIAARLDTRAASATDDISATLDYEEVVREISKIVSSEAYQLVETLADRIARTILEHPFVEDVWVRIVKPLAPLSEEVDEVAVEITRQREDLGRS
ncbi:MAG TPA: dihydroneopterin aldolase [Actinomycetota bacterium]|nr:dihydroneopterin aldolase [Actinomycetota bacterium]